MQRHCASEFTRLCKPGRDFLILSELRQLESVEDMPLDISHLGTLWVLDRHDSSCQRRVFAP